MKLGIDFGTCFSLAAVQNPRRPELLTLLPPGVYGIPSLFFYHSDKGVKTGKAAKKYAYLQDEEAKTGKEEKNHLVRSIKMKLKSSKPYKFTQKVYGSNMPIRFTASQIIAYILEEVVQTAERRARKDGIYEPLEGMVISVPAKFEHNERAKILEAAKILQKKKGPGYKALGLIKEPVAAALYYFKEMAPPDQTRILVYDLGGGTCDIALVEADSSQREHYRVIDADMLRIGGNDWDEKLATYITRELKPKAPELYADEYRETTVLRVEDAANQAKHDFSAYDLPDTVDVDIPTNSGDNVCIPITREVFYQLTSDLLTKTILKTKELLERNAGHPVTELICVGGSCNMPQVPEALKAAFPNMNVKVTEPEYAVAKGAAVYATQTVSLLDIAPHSYGICVCLNRDLNDQAVLNLIRANAPLPARVQSNEFFSSYDKVVFSIYESEIKDAQYKYDSGKQSPIMEVTLRLPPNTPLGTRLYTTITLTQDGILEVTADDRRGHIIRGEKRLLL